MIHVDKQILKKIYKRRPLESKKYDYGLLVVIGGSEFYSGPPALAAMAAYRSGADMVRIIAPERAADIIASLAPEMAAFPLKGERITQKHVAAIVSMIESARVDSRNHVAMVLGGGLGRSPETQEAVVSILSQVSVPTVIDADAIYVVSENRKLIFNKPFIITPHSHDFFVLTQKDVDNISDERRYSLVQQAAKELRTTILLKGKTDMISNGEEIALCRTGTPYMTVGGTGDTLAGIAGALLARGVNAFEAAQAASYLNGKAGEIASKDFKESLMPTDVLDAIPEAMKRALA